MYPPLLTEMNWWKVSLLSGNNPSLLTLSNHMRDSPNHRVHMEQPCSQDTQQIVQLFLLFMLQE